MTMPISEPTPPVNPVVPAPTAPPVNPAPVAPPTAPPVPAPPPVPTPPPVPPVPPAPVDNGRDLSSQPAWVQQEITKLRDEAAKNRVAAKTQTINNAVIVNAGAYGVNAQALLGSTEWATRAAGLDPHAADYAIQLQAAVAATIQACPWVAAAPATPPAAPPPPTSGADFPGGGGAGVPITEAQLAQMSQADIAKAYAEGKLAHLL